MEQNNSIKYRIFVFLAFTFLLTWVCAILKAYANFDNHRFFLYIVDFIESASPLIVAIVLLRNYFSKQKVFHFFFGKFHGWLNYLIVFTFFVLQFLNFYLFRINNDPIKITVFLTMFLSQLFFGGGLEEAGWRGYLQPALERKIPLILAVLIVGIIWSLWHLPYFFLPGLHYGANFFAYIIIVTITSFILVAIYKLTGSIILCTLFHGWQNAIVMTIPANQEHIGFMLFFLGLGIASIIICLFYNKKSKKWYIT
jgi:membrane protease YdiL (CAAX protease family)